MKELSKRQKAVLVQIARRAYQHQLAKGQIEGIDFNTWRHDEVERAVGKPGLRACGNAEYNTLAAHFEGLAGEDGRALDHLLRAGSDSRRQAEYVLLAELTTAGLPLDYAEKISRSRFGVAVTATTDHQFKQLLITVKQRTRSRRRNVKHEVGV